MSDDLFHDGNLIMVSDRSLLSIVLADDDPDDQLLIREAFRKTDLSEAITIANDGVELLDYLDLHRGAGAARRPDLILLDLNMPRMDGREALAAIKGDPDLRTIPVVVLTTSGDEDDILKTYLLGASSYIRKPVTFSGLVDVVEHINKYWFELVELPPGGNRVAKSPA